MPVSILLRVEIPSQNLQKSLLFEPHLPVWFAKQLILDKMSKDEENVINYGLFIPPANGRAGKFLDEERLLASYSLENNDLVSFRLKRKLYRDVIDDKQLIEYNSKSSRKKFGELVAKGNVEKIQKMLKSGTDPNFVLETGDTPLALAAGRDMKDMIVVLVDGGAYMDYRCANSHTPLHTASILGSTLALKTMLDLGASPNYRDKLGLTPLYHACMTGQQGSAELLLKYEAQLQQCDQQAWSELHQACKHGHAAIVDLLVWYGAMINAQNVTGNTAMHVSILQKQPNCTKILLKRGASKDIQNKGAQTPFQMAAMSGLNEIAEFIRAFKPEDVVRFTAEPAYERRKRSSNASSSGSSTPKTAHKAPASAAKKKVQVTRLAVTTKGRVLYPYRASRADELELNEGDTIEIFQKGDDGWWEGINGERTGWFPSNYVEEHTVPYRNARDSVLIPPPPPVEDMESEPVADGATGNISLWMSTDRLSRFMRQASMMSLNQVGSTMSLNTVGLAQPSAGYFNDMPPPPPEFGGGSSNSSSGPASMNGSSTNLNLNAHPPLNKGNSFGSIPPPQIPSAAAAIMNRGNRAASFNTGSNPVFIPPPPSFAGTSFSSSSLPSSMPPPTARKPSAGSYNGTNGVKTTTVAALFDDNSLPPPPPVDFDFLPPPPSFLTNGSFDLHSLPPPPPAMLDGAGGGYFDDGLPLPPPPPM
ncbi:hypothetical protein CAOG_01460 [Capsaspora owczarzaki ATCC 30864]|uniref:SH3 domain-containing protein n=1 Tax=Capsaspora owczarzaki (strain ATCC 30864) TaxID=595528 RepID=A0A0D2X133_CAPO3|nr:hypothetical protein CAOG_01460 [Capsaspora owczarzaki ATCC 30864]KJE90109.1 hypothetical protein CAOG_001460 [Capsaspora owczarzaki ATCC 30864]|eukprot:XP_004364328.2 hypothetical protein CAOG_01460 [Capsaspora owczarzaki ATCC 30864]